MKPVFILLCLVMVLFLTACGRESDPNQQGNTAPDWIEGTVWYQIFPERFRNGDPSNDPRASEVPWAEFQQNWRIHPWTSDWYRVQPWEKTHTDAFYTVVYQRRYGGDIQGIIDKLDYLNKLGIRVIYFNPLFEGESLHKYDGANFHHIDDNFGPDPQGDKQRLALAAETNDPSTWIRTSADSLFLHLLKEAHSRNIKIVIDGVFNHSGTAFFAFRDVREKQQDSPYADWYEVQRWDDPQTEADEFEYSGWWDDKTLPVFREDENGLTKGPREYIFHITRRWMDPDGDGDPSDGVDGWRLDAADEVADAFWVEWHDLVRSINPDAITMAENWKVSAEWIREDIFDTVTNYPFAYVMLDFFINQEKAIDAAELARRLEELVAAYGQKNAIRLVNIVESHDTERIASMILNPDRRGYDRDGSLRDNVDYIVRKPKAQERKVHRQIAAFQMAFIGSPLIFYGTEAGMWGADDPDDRKPMLWKELTYEDEASHPVKGRTRPADPNIFDAELFSFYQHLIRLKEENSALQRGRFTVLNGISSGDLFGFTREDEDQTVLCLFNRSDDIQTVTVDPSTQRIALYRDGMSGAEVDFEQMEGRIEIPGNGFRILLSE